MTTPTCPACGAKFAHSNESLQCTKCGLPDFVIHLGASGIRQWKIEKEMRARGIGRRQAERVLSIRGGSAGRRRNKHGRRGVAR